MGAPGVSELLGPVMRAAKLHEHEHGISNVCAKTEGDERKKNVVYQ